MFKLLMLRGTPKSIVITVLLVSFAIPVIIGVAVVPGVIQRQARANEGVAQVQENVGRFLAPLSPGTQTERFEASREAAEGQKSEEARRTEEYREARDQYRQNRAARLGIAD